MKVECKIDPDCREPYAVIHISEMTPAIGEAISILERAGGTAALAAVRDEKTYFLAPEELDLVRTEGREIVCYDSRKNRYAINRPLYELESVLGNRFIRISKSAVINIRRIDHVKAGLNGTMELVMKNGVKDFISRSYRKSFKERIGLS